RSIMNDNPNFSAVPPIVLNPSDGKGVELIGSGVLIRIINRTFLLTAAHVTDRRSDGTLLIPGRKGFVEITGCFSAMRVPASGRRMDDRLDVAYYCLDDDCLSALNPAYPILERPDALLEAAPTRRLAFT